MGLPAAPEDNIVAPLNDVTYVSSYIVYGSRV